MLAAVPATLLAVFVLPRASKVGLALRYTDPTFLSLFANHYVHFDAGHLATNVAVGTAVVSTLFALARATDGDGTRWFDVTVTVVIVAFPPVLSGLNLLLVRDRLGFGASGLAMAFVGLLPVALFAYLGRFDDRIGIDHAPVVFFTAMLPAAALVAPSARAALIAGGVSVLAVGLYLRSLYVTVPLGKLIAAVRRRGDPELVAAAVALSVGLPVAAFLPGGTAARTVPNVYSHLLGFCLGFLGGYFTARLATNP
jgi:uncharacterized membrane protein YGL010W